jgi:hypothetical protein
MSFFKTEQLKIKKTEDVGIVSKLILAGSHDLSYNFVFIQNVGDTPLWLSLGGESATLGNVGEIKVIPNADYTLPFQGNIYAIREVVSTNANNCIVIAY